MELPDRSYIKSEFIETVSNEFFPLAHVLQFSSLNKLKAIILCI